MKEIGPRDVPGTPLNPPFNTLAGPFHFHAAIDKNLATK